MSKLEKLASVGLTDSPEDIKKFYDMFPTPDSYDAYMSVEQKYAMGGIINEIAFPQQPKASFAYGGVSDKQFFAPNYMPWNGPIGFYQPGGENQDLINQFNTGDISREDINAQINSNFNIPFNRQNLFEGPDPQPGFTKTNDMNFFINRGIPDYNDEDMSDLDRSRKRPPTGGGGGNSANMDFRRWKANINRKWRGFKQNLRDKVKTCIGDACPKWEDGGFIDGIAFPQQPTEHINFSAFPWKPKYQPGGRIGVTGNMTGGLDREALIAMDPENMDTDLRNINDKRLMLEYQKNLKNGPFADKFPVSLVGTVGAQSGLGRDIIYNNRGDATGMTDWNPSVNPTGSIGLRWNAGERNRRNKGLSMAGSNWGVGASYENQGLYPYMELNPRADYPLNKNLTAFGEYNLRLRPDIGIGPMSTQGELYSGAAKNNLMLGLAGNYNGIQPTLSGGYNFATQSPVFQGGVNIPLRKMGGGLPGGPNEGMPCMECGGYMEDGGDTQYGGMVDQEGKMNYFKEGGNWIQKATKNMRTDKPCTGSKFGGPSCPPGSKRYNLAKTFRKMAKKEYGGMAGAGMDDTDSYVQQYNNDFLERVLPQQQQDMGMEQQMPMAYNGMSIPQAYNMNPFGYNPYGSYKMSYEQEQNSQPINQQNVMNNYGYQRANKNLRRQNMGILGAALSAAQPWTDESRLYMDTKFTPWNDPNKQNTNTTNPGGGMTNNAKHGGNHPLLKAQAGIINPSSNAKPASWDDANPDTYLDAWYNRKFGSKSSCGPNGCFDNGSQEVPKWDPNDPSKYLDYYFNKRKSANNQTNYDYDKWSSWDNVNYNDGSYTYNRPYAGGWGGMTQPMANYFNKTFGDPNSEYVLGPGSVDTEYGRGFLGLFQGKRPKKRTYTFNVYKKKPGEPMKESERLTQKREMDPEDRGSWLQGDRFAEGGQYTLPRAAGGFQNTTPNDISNMYTALEKLNAEKDSEGQVVLQEELKRDITGDDKAKAFMTAAEVFNVGDRMGDINRNLESMAVTADDIYDPMQAGRTGYQGNFLETGMGTGQEFGGKNRAYGVQKGMPGMTGFIKYDDGGEYNVGDEYDLTDEEIAELEAQGYVVEDVQDNMDDFA